MQKYKLNETVRQNIFNQKRLPIKFLVLKSVREIGFTYFYKITYYKNCELSAFFCIFVNYCLFVLIIFLFIYRHMKKILFFFSIAIISIIAHAQQETLDNQVVRNVYDRGVKGLDVSYFFSKIQDYPVYGQQTKFVRLHVKDFTFLKEVGKPALPAHYDIVLIPDGAVSGIVLKNAPYVMRDSLLVYPALRPATDRYGDPEPAFEIDSAFYQTNQWYPENPVSIVNVLKVKGISLAVVQVCPVQYNPQLRQIKAYSTLDYEISFTKSTSLIDEKELYSSTFLKNLQNIVLNSFSLNAEISTYSATLKSPVTEKVAGAKNYIIVTHSDYRAAADSLAKWKSQLGYAVEIISRSNWTSTLVKSEVHNRYQSWVPKPDYFVILGDHDKVPGEIHQDPSYGDNFATDLYYACMDGAYDYVADMAFGRISVGSATEAMTVVNKIITYEKNPPVEQNFYTKGSVCGYFQDDDTDTYEDRRFLLTSEEIRNYMMAHGFAVNRIYDADASVNPRYYNDGYYANSEPLPYVLLRTNGFGWNGTKDTIAASINSADGRLFVTHRDHGYSGGTGWASPQFTTTNINLLNNGNRLPVVFSINCHTGEFQLQECFAEKFLRKTNGGAVGVFGAAYFSWSGYNDGLIEGMIDAIWATPGLIPPFTGNGDSPVGSPVAHQPIYTMGDVLNQGLMRMIQTWGDDDYTHELFHYFGDPAMKIWTAFPGNITATHQTALDCHDTTFTINTSSCNHCLATLVVDGELIASDSLNSTPLTLHFSPVLGSNAVLTLSRHNYKPYIANIPFTAACMRPDFFLTYSNACAGHPITVTDASSGDILSYIWDFGAGATPQTANSAGPFQVTYSSPGMKLITLTITSATASETFIDSVFIEQPCIYSSVQNQHIQIGVCQGTLFDNGGMGNYLANSNDTVTISVPGATSVILNFIDFDVEQGDNGSCNFDHLEIFDGANTSAPLIGSYCSLPGHTPPASIASSGNSITLHLFSDAYVEGRGYEIDFNCSVAGQPPSVSFTAAPMETCDGLIAFTDHSTNSPVSFHWDFGDGDTSNLQNPVHSYPANGSYTISLTAANAYGSNIYTRIDYVTVQRPVAPVALHDTLCGPAAAQLSAMANGTVRWYDDELAGNLLHSGATFTTPVLDTITTYYAESSENEIHTLGAPDTLIGSGGYYTSTSAHYLIFDCLDDVLLVSADVFSNYAGTRTLSLQTAGGIIYDTLINLPPGKTTVYFNWNIPSGTNYRLVAPANCRLYRNTTGAAYPYSDGHLVKITGSSYNTSTYYYFYNWKVKGGECRSPRTPVTAFVYTSEPDASYTFSNSDNTTTFANTSSGAYAFVWDFGDGSQSVETSPVHTFAGTGSYTVTLTAVNACGNDVYNDNVDILSIGVSQNENIRNLCISPNPADESIWIKWDSDWSAQAEIVLTDICGQQMLNKKISVCAGGNSEYIDLSRFAQGVYFVELITGKQKAVVKLVVL